MTSVSVPCKSAVVLPLPSVQQPPQPMVRPENDTRAVIFSWQHAIERHCRLTHYWVRVIERQVGSDSWLDRQTVPTMVEYPGKYHTESGCRL
eukprot:5824607-Prymnesium_polylepis.1